MRTNCLGTALSNQEHSLRHIKGGKRIGRNTVTRAAALKGMKRRVATEQGCRGVELLQVRSEVESRSTLFNKGNFIVVKSRLRKQLKSKKKTPWSEFASELYRPSDRRLSAKSLPTFEDNGCHVVSVTDPYGRILGFLDRSRYFSIK
jgi:hypothetical protein